MGSPGLPWADPAGPWAQGVSGSGQELSWGKATRPVCARVRSRQQAVISAAHELQPDRRTHGNHPQLRPSRPPTVCRPPGVGSSSEPALGEATASNPVAVKRKQVHRLMKMSRLSSSSKSKEHKKEFGSPGEKQTETEEREERDKAFRRVVAGPSLSTYSLRARSTPRTF